MSGTVIREVLIKLKLQSDGLKIQPPDISAVLGAYEQLRKAQAAVMSRPSNIAAMPQAQQPAAIAAATGADGLGASGSSRLDKRMKGIAEAAAEERKARQEEYRIAEEADKRRTKLAEDTKKAYEKALKEKHDWIARDTAASEKAAAAEEQRQAKAMMRAKAAQQAPGARGTSGYLAGPNGRGQADRTRSQDGIDNQKTGAVGLGGNTQLVYTAGEAYKMAGEGVFHLARGVAFLNAASEEEIAILVKKIAYYQGVFEIFKGTIDVVNGMTRGTRALAAATAMSTGADVAAVSARAAHTAAIIGEGTAITGGTAALVAHTVAKGYDTVTYSANTGIVMLNGVAHTRLQFIMLRTAAVAASTWAFITGPIGLALIGLGIAGYAAWSHITEAVKEHRDELERVRMKALHAMLDIEGATRRAEQAQRDLNKARQAYSDYAAGSTLAGQINEVERSVITGGIRSNDYLTERERATEEAQIQQAEYEAQQAQAAKEREGAKTRFDIAARAALSASAGSNNVAAQQAIQGYSEQELKDKLKHSGETAAFNASTGQSRGQAELDKAREQSAANPEDAKLKEHVLNLERKMTAELNAQKTAQQVRQNYAKDMLEANKRELQLLTDRKNSLQQLMAQERARLDANRQAQIDEGNRNKSAIQKFGEMSAYEQQVIRDIAAKLKAANGDVSQLNQGEIERLRQSGFADAALSHYDLAQGTAAGGQEVLDNLGFTKPGTTDQAEGQGQNETRGDFLKRQEAEARAAIQQQEQQWQEILKQQRDASKKVTAGLKEVADLNPIVELLERLIAAMLEKFEVMRKRVEQAEKGLSNSQIQRPR